MPVSQRSGVSKNTKVMASSEISVVMPTDFDDVAVINIHIETPSSICSSPQNIIIKIGAG